MVTIKSETKLALQYVLSKVLIYEHIVYKLVTNDSMCIFSLGFTHRNTHLFGGKG
jgi:hypothetical protein